MTSEQKERFLKLGRDLPALWDHPQASDELKKRILRTALCEIMITDSQDGSTHILQMHWQGGVHTELRVPRNTTGHRRVTTQTASLDLIRELSKVCDDQAIAATLNRLGHRTGAGDTWRVHSVQNARHYYRLPNHQKAGQWLTVEETSQALGVSHTVIRRMIRERLLPATQVAPRTPWVIEREALSLPAVMAAAQAVREGRQLLPQAPNQGQLPFK